MSSTLESRFETALAALEAIPTDAAAYSAITDASLLRLTDFLGRLQRALGADSALISGEVARRSSPHLGHSGLAQGAGFRTPEELIRSATGGTAREAAQAVSVGRLAHGDEQRPWLAPVGAAVTDEHLPLAAAQSIGLGLGLPTSSVPTDVLAAAALQLCDEARTLDADHLLQRARAVRTELDLAGVPLREEERRAQRSLRFYRQSDGLSRLTWQLDPETAALVGEVYDRATSPRRGGPRFTESSADGPDAERIADDPRTTEQLASDVFLQLLQAGADADSSELLSTGAPSIRVLTTGSHGYIEGQHDPVSAETVERLRCSGSVTPIVVRDGQPIDVGREQRLYTRRQRVALAARDGGCRWPGCDRPPSWTEAHHINHWARDHGRTDVADGILLCRHHHLLAHNNHWQITRDGDEYWLVPPPEQDPQQRPRPMPSSSAPMRELRAAHTAAAPSRAVAALA
jgi:hypothetical protein